MSEQEWLECQDLAKMISYLQEIMRRKRNVAWRLAFWLLGGGWSVTERRLRAFLLGSFEALNHQSSDPRSREALGICERLVDGRVSAGDVVPFEPGVMAVVQNDFWRTACDANDALWQEARRATEQATLEGSADAAAWHDWASLVEEFLPGFSPPAPPQASRWNAVLLANPLVCAAREASRVAWQAWRAHEALRYMVCSRIDTALGAAHYIASYRAEVLAMHLEEQEARREAERELCQLVRDAVGDPFTERRRELRLGGDHRDVVRSLAQAIYEDRRFGDLPILADALEDADCTDSEVLAHCRQPSKHIRACWVLGLLLGTS
jgi:hypothetical protein